jgi:antitoxin VapB
VTETGVGRLFMHGRSQAVRLPLRFRLPGDRVRIRRVEGGILLEPIVTDNVSEFARVAGLTWQDWASAGGPTG